MVSSCACNNSSCSPVVSEASVLDEVLHRAKLDLEKNLRVELQSELRREVQQEMRTHLATPAGELRDLRNRQERIEAQLAQLVQAVTALAHVPGKDASDSTGPQSSSARPAHLEDATSGNVATSHMRTVPEPVAQPITPREFGSAGGDVIADVPGRLVVAQSRLLAAQGASFLCRGGFSALVAPWITQAHGCLHAAFEASESASAQHAMPVLCAMAAQLLGLPTGLEAGAPFSQEALGVMDQLQDLFRQSVQSPEDLHASVVSAWPFYSVMHATFVVMAHKASGANPSLKTEALDAGEFKRVVP